MSNQSAFPGRFILAADITLTSPLHISAIEKGRYDSETRRIGRYATAPGDQACTLTRTLRLSDQSFTVKDADSETERAVYGVEIPIIPASTIGGRMRNAAADLIFESLVARDLQISSAAYNTLCTGSASTKPDGNTTPEVLKIARGDAFFSNFGGTSFMLASRSVICDGVPLLRKTLDMLMSAPILDDASILPHESLRQMTSAATVVRKDAVLDMKGPHIESVVDRESILEHLELSSQRTEAKKADKALQKAAKAAGERVEAGKKEDLRTLSAFEVVDSGLSFALRIRVDAVSAQQLGLMIMALQSILRSAQFGGKAARGCGQFICPASRLLTVDPKTNRITDTNALFGMKSDGYEVVDGDDFIAQAINAAQDYLDSVSPAVFEAFAKSNLLALKELCKDEEVSA